MLFFVMLEDITMLVLSWFIVTQVLIPGVKGRPVFPMFRKERTLRQILLEQQQLSGERALEQTIEENARSLNPVPPTLPKVDNKESI